MLATKSEGAVRLVSRNGLDHTRRFPELVKALVALKPATFTLDGEVAVYDEELLVHPAGVVDRAGDFDGVHELGSSGGVRLTGHGEETTPDAAERLEKNSSSTPPRAV